MKCPIDGADLRMSERNGIEIDYCPQCRGIWMDRGELDKIMDREAQYLQEQAAKQQPPAVQQPPMPQQPPMMPGQPYAPTYGTTPPPTQRPVIVVDDDDDYYRHQQYPPGHPQYRKRKTFLGELFDVFD